MFRRMQVSFWVLFVSLLSLRGCKSGGAACKSAGYSKSDLCEYLQAVSGDVMLAERILYSKSACKVTRGAVVDKYMCVCVCVFV